MQRTDASEAEIELGHWSSAPVSGYSWERSQLQSRSSVIEKQRIRSAAYLTVLLTSVLIFVMVPLALIAVTSDDSSTSDSAWTAAAASTGAVLAFALSWVKIVLQRSQIRRLRARVLGLEAQSMTGPLAVYYSIRQSATRTWASRSVSNCSMANSSSRMRLP